VGIGDARGVKKLGGENMQNKETKATGSEKQVLKSLEFTNDSFEAVAPLGDTFLVKVGGTGCDVCCPGSCTGCTQCNRCNLLF
jgi:hypothetical protein